MEKIVIRSSQGCSRCVGLKRNLKSSNVPFVEIDLSENVEELELVKRLLNVQFVSLPVVSYNNEMFDATNMTEILRLVKNAKLDIEDKDRVLV